MKKNSIYLGVRSKLDSLLMIMHSPTKRVSTDRLSFFTEYLKNPEDKMVECYVHDKEIDDSDMNNAWKSIGISVDAIPIDYIYYKYFEIIRETEEIKVSYQRNKTKVDNN